MTFVHFRSILNSVVPRQAKKLDTCPFCYDTMPSTMSAGLIEMMQFWLDQYHLGRRIGSTSTVEACQMHRNEKLVIPEGLKRGWLKVLEEDKLKRRIQNEKKTPFMTVLKRRVKEPTSSEWFNSLIEERKKFGRKIEQAHHQVNNMSDMHAG